MDSGGPREACTRWGPDPPCEGAIIRGKDMPGYARRHSAMSCSKMAEPIDMPTGLWSGVGRSKHKFDCICQVAPMCPHGREHWRNLANTIEPSVCGGDVALLPHAVNCVRFCFWRCLRVFCLCMKYLGNRCMDLHQIHREDVFCPSHGGV